MLTNILSYHFRFKSYITPSILAVLRPRCIFPPTFPDRPCGSHAKTELSVLDLALIDMCLLELSVLKLSVLELSLLEFSVLYTTFIY